MQHSRPVSLAVMCVLASFLVGALVPSLANAGTAQVVDPDPGPPHLTFTAAAGEANHLYLLPAPRGYRLIDLGADITAGAGCSSMSSSEVFCAVVFADESPTIDILLGDQSDFASVAGQGSNEITVDGEGGADELELGAGCEFGFDLPCDAFLLGGLGDDMLTAEGAFRIDGGAGGDSMAGGIVDYSARVSPVTVDGDGVADDGEAGEGDNVADTVFTAIGGSAGDTFIAISARGGDGNDTFTAGEDGHFFEGQEGDDVCLGSATRDLCEGGPGEDQLMGGGGGDDLFGGGGADTIRGGPGRDLIFGDSGNDLLFGDEGGDFIGGGRGDDTIRARDGTRDRIQGAQGFDRARIDRGLDVVESVEAFF